MEIGFSMLGNEKCLAQIKRDGLTNHMTFLQRDSAEPVQNVFFKKQVPLCGPFKPNLFFLLVMYKLSLIHAFFVILSFFSEMSRPRTFSEDYRTNIFVVRAPFGMITVHANDHLVS